MIDASVEQHVSIPPSLLSTELHSLEIVVVNLSHVVSAEALSFKLLVLMHFTFGDLAVVELVPLFGTSLISGE